MMRLLGLTAALLSLTRCDSGPGVYSKDGSTALDRGSSNGEGIAAEPLSIVTPALPRGQAYVDYSVALEARGGIKPYRWKLDGRSALPAGLSLDGSSGVIAGAPAVAGTFAIDFWVTDANATATSARLPLVIADNTVVLFIAPAAGQSLSGITTVAATVRTTLTGTPWVRLCLDSPSGTQCSWGASNWIADGSPALWDTTLVTDGAHLIRADGFLTADYVGSAVQKVAVLNQGSVSATVSIDFSSHLRPVSPHAFAFVDNLWGPNILSSPTLATVFKKLSASEVRTPLAFDPPTNSDPSTGNLDCNFVPGYCTGLTADAIVKAYKDIGLEPLVLVPVYSYYDPAACGASDPFCLSHTPFSWDPTKHASVEAISQSATLAANMVHWFKRRGISVTRFIIGNEEDLGGPWPTVPWGMTPGQAGTYFNAIYDAMQDAAASSAGGESPMPLLPSGKRLTIGGPAVCCGDSTTPDRHDWLGQWVQKTGSRVDFIDVHFYSSNAPGDQTAANLLAGTHVFEDEINAYRAALGVLPSRADGVTAASIEMHMGEWAQDVNTMEDYLAADGTHSASLYFSPFEVVYGASVIGHILTAGGNARYFAAMDGLNSLTADLNQDACLRDHDNACLSPTQSLAQLYQAHGLTQGATMPIYHALGAFTGESVFAHFGKYLTAAAVQGTGASWIEVYASDQPRNVVLINKSPTQPVSALLSFNSATAPTARAYAQQGGPFAPPSILPPPDVSGDASTGWRVNVSIPEYSVTTVTLDP